MRRRSFGWQDFGMVGPCLVPVLVEQAVWCHLQHWHTASHGTGDKGSRRFLLREHMLLWDCPTAVNVGSATVIEVLFILGVIRGLWRLHHPPQQKPSAEHITMPTKHTYMSSSSQIVLMKHPRDFLLSYQQAGCCWYTGRQKSVLFASADRACGSSPPLVRKKEWV